MRGYDRDRYGSSLRLGPKPDTGETQQVKEPMWKPLAVATEASSSQPTPVGYRPQTAQPAPTPIGYRPDSIAGMLQGGQSNQAIVDMVLRKMLYGG